VNAEFWKAARKLFGGLLSQAQVNGIETILAASEGLPIGHRAYLLATAKHETADTMQPITEYGGRKYFDKYDTGKLAKALGNTPDKDGDGYLYRGRGYVQITGRANYSKTGDKLGVDLIANPDAALNPTLAARILVRGCSEGWFTGKKLSDYLGDDFRNARRVVNGTDKADLIAGYAIEFGKALATETGYKLPSNPVDVNETQKSDPQNSADVNETPKSEHVAPVVLTKPSIWSQIIAAILAILKGPRK
jgi:hypothetical protein